MTSFSTLLQQNCFATDLTDRRAAAKELETTYGCEINCVAIDPSVQFAHHAKGCIVIASKLSANVIIFQNVTIGSNQKFNRHTNQWENLGNPVLGENVIVADGAKILGPVVIGPNTVIGAGAIITKDVPADSLAYGVNQIRPRDLTYDLIFHDPLPTREENLAACQAVIARAELVKH